MIIPTIYTIKPTHRKTGVSKCVALHFPFPRNLKRPIIRPRIRLTPDRRHHWWRSRGTSLSTHKSPRRKIDNRGLQQPFPNRSRSVLELFQKIVHGPLSRAVPKKVLDVCYATDCSSSAVDSVVAGTREGRVRSTLWHWWWCWYRRA